MVPTTPHGPAVWATSAWRGEAVAWLDDVLAARDVRRVGPVAQMRIRPWSTLLRARTGRGAVWLKATVPAMAAEVALYPLIASVAGECVLAPLAVDVERGWLLLPDGGPSLAETAHGSVQLDGLARALVAYADVQRRLADHTDELLGVGLPDMRPAAMPQRFEEAMVASSAHLPGVDDDLRRAYRDITRLGPTVAAWSALLVQADLPAMIDHNDLHPGNVLQSGARVRFYDWGDAVVACGLAAARVPLQVLRDSEYGGEGSAVLRAAREGYLRALHPDVPLHDLARLLDAACRLGTVARVLTWERGLRALLDAEAPVPPEWRSAPVEVLVSLLDASPYGRG